MLEQLKSRAAVTLSCAVQRLGPVPDECGDVVRNVLGGSDEMAVMALGCCLEDCMEKGNFDPLKKADKDIPHKSPAKTLKQESK